MKREGGGEEKFDSRRRLLYILFHPLKRKASLFKSRVGTFEKKVS